MDDAGIKGLNLGHTRLVNWHMNDRRGMNEWTDGLQVLFLTDRSHDSQLGWTGLDLFSSKRRGKHKRDLTKNGSSHERWQPRGIHRTNFLSGMQEKRMKEGNKHVMGNEGREGRKQTENEEEEEDEDEAMEVRTLISIFFLHTLLLSLTYEKFKKKKKIR